MIIRRWIEGFKTGDSDVIGMVCCEIGLVFGLSATVWVGMAFAAKGISPNTLTAALIFAIPGIVIAAIALLIILGVAIVQLFRAIFGPQSTRF